MPSNTLSVIILILCVALILGVIFSKRVRKINNHQLDSIKEYEERLSVEEKTKRIETQKWGILVIEILVWSMLFLGAFFAASKV